MHLIERPLAVTVKQHLIEHKLPGWLADIMARRVHSPELATALMTASLSQLPNPNGLPDMALAVTLLTEALTHQQRIVCVVDYDTDGISSGAILQEGLSALGAHIQVMVTNRHEDGYGFSAGACRRLLALDSLPDVLITADLGSSDGLHIADLQQQLAERGKSIRIIVTDHHHISSTHPPKTADAFINPHRQDSQHHYTHPICGAMVAWNLVAALRASLRQQTTYPELNQKAQAVDMKHLLDLAAIATVGDMVDLAHPINRTVVRFGLQRINERQRPAWQLLKEALDSQASINEDTIGFQISPRINALSRMGDDGHTALMWLTTQHMSSCQQAWAVMSQTNEARKDEQALCETLAMTQAEQQMLDQCFMLIAYVPEVSHGVVGLAAGKLAQRFGRPAIVFSDTDNGQLTGSARSIPGYDIRALLEQVQAKTGLMTKYGGHAAAAGLSINSLADLPSLSQALQQQIQSDFRDNPPEACLHHDGALPKELTTIAGVNALANLGPFGQGLPAASFLLTASIVGQRVLGKSGQHKRLTLAGDFGELEAVWFNASTTCMLIEHPQTRYRFVVQMTINHFRGNRQLQAMIQAVEPSI